jgi:hypothetical protein
MSIVSKGYSADAARNPERREGCGRDIRPRRLTILFPAVCCLMKESPLDRAGNKHGYRVIPEKCDTGRIGADGVLLCDRCDERMESPDTGVPFPQRFVKKGERYTLVDNYECTLANHVKARRHRRHMIYQIDGRPQFRRILSYVNGKALLPG